MILVTGGAGYIGSHTWVWHWRLPGQPYLVLDNFSNSNPGSSGARWGKLPGSNAPMHVQGDVRDAALRGAQGRGRVGGAAAALLRKQCGGHAHPAASAMQAAQVRKPGVLVLGHGVWRARPVCPSREDFPLSATNPYGWSKLMVEQMLADVDAAEPGQWRIARLRYFNPVGAHESGLIGEDPRDVPNNLLPYVAQVAAGQRERLSVYGNDYPTPDGTGVRDYIHVCDLADGHVAALRYLQQHPGLLTVNLGTGRPVSVLEMVRGFEQASGRPVPYQVVARRPGDVAACWADPALAERLLGWKAHHGVERMCQDAWRWQDGVARSLHTP
jgi:UDP-glucose 4-epimerase